MTEDDQPEPIQSLYDRQSLPYSYLLTLTWLIADLTSGDEGAGDGPFSAGLEGCFGHIGKFDLSKEEWG